MLRSEFYRQLEEQHKLSETEKAVLRERMAGIEAERAREEGKRLELERENESLRGNAVDLTLARRRLDEALQQAESTAASFHAEKELQQTDINRLQSELDATRASLEEEKASRETSVVVFDDILFAPGAKTLSREQVERIKVAEDKLQGAEHITVAGHTDDRERGHGIELAASRAAAVVKVLREMLGASGDHFTVIARGEDQPRDASGTTEARTKNRRVEVVAIFGR